MGTCYLGQGMVPSLAGIGLTIWIGESSQRPGSSAEPGLWL